LRAEHIYPSVEALFLVQGVEQRQQQGRAARRILRLTSISGPGKNCKAIQQAGARSGRKMPPTGLDRDVGEACLPQQVVQRVAGGENGRNRGAAGVPPIRAERPIPGVRRKPRPGSARRSLWLDCSTCSSVTMLMAASNVRSGNGRISRIAQHVEFRVVPTSDRRPRDPARSYRCKVEVMLVGRPSPEPASSTRTPGLKLAAKPETASSMGRLEMHHVAGQRSRHQGPAACRRSRFFTGFDHDGGSGRGTPLRAE